MSHFDSFEVYHIPKKIKKFIGNKNITNIYRIQAYNSIMCGYLCIGFIDFRWKGKSLLEYTSLFSPNQYKKNDKIILKYFQYWKRYWNFYCIISSKYRKFEKLKISYILENIFLLIHSKYNNEHVKIIIYNYFKNMSQEFRLKNINEIHISLKK